MKFFLENGKVVDGSLSEIIDETWLLTVLIPIITKKSNVSIRLIDWFCTNYSKEKQVSYHWIDARRGVSRVFYVHTEYKTTLRRKSKNYFDPFRRVKGTRMKFFIGDQEYHTTMAQIIFFQWADKYKVLDFLHANAEDVEKHMGVRQEAGKMRRKKRKAREALSMDPRTTVMVFPQKCTIAFDSDDES